MIPRLGTSDILYYVWGSSHLVTSIVVLLFVFYVVHKSKSNESGLHKVLTLITGLVFASFYLVLGLLLIIGTFRVIPLGWSNFLLYLGGCLVLISLIFGGISKIHLSQKVRQEK
jgi:hypothetical protein